MFRIVATVLDPVRQSRWELSIDQKPHAATTTVPATWTAA